MLNIKKKIWIIKQKELGKLTDSEIASVQKVTRMTVHRSWIKYKKFGINSLENKQLGRPKQDIPKDITNLVLKTKKTNRLGRK